MQQKKKSILFISHQSGRTGAPILLLSLMKWLYSNSSFNLILLAREDGDLISAYQEVSKVIFYNQLESVFNNECKFFKLFDRLFPFFKLRVFKIKTRYLFNKYNISLIYSNTVANGDILEKLRTLFNTKTITHVHEGSKLLDTFYSNKSLDKSISFSDEFISVSEFVKNLLKSKFNVQKSITVIPGATDINYQFQDISFGNKNNEISIMCCSYLNWDKGMDFFIQIIKSFTSTNTSVKFYWVGVDFFSIEYKQMLFDLEKLDLINYVCFLPNQSNSKDYINKTDILLILSRSESFSLVAIEAGLARKPFLCFKGSGGPCEIINYDNRFIVEYADINGMTNRLLDLCSSDCLRKEMGEYLCSRVTEFYSIDKTAYNTLELISKMLS